MTPNRQRATTFGWLIMVLAVGLAIGAGYLAGTFGGVVALRAIGSVLIPVLLASGIGIANKSEHGKALVVVPVALLWGFAAAGVWWLVTR